MAESEQNGLQTGNDISPLAGSALAGRFEPPHCPLLPEPLPQMTHRAISKHGAARDAAFYLDCLRYAHYLWLHATPARAQLALTRALYTPLQADDAVYGVQPWPYAVYVWLWRWRGSGQRFWGNPRISFQHQALRIRGHDRHAALCRARATAVWLLATRQCPELAADPQAAEPDAAACEQLFDTLATLGSPAEALTYATVISNQCHLAGS
jgi:hypothetical protein